MIINTDTSLYGVIGDPISHSLSPAIHNRAFQHIGYNGVYCAFNVKDIASAISGVRGFGIKGLSVTIPHKLSVMEHIDQIDETALKIGAVNTVVNKDGRLFGYNTDWMGATNALLEKTAIKNKKVLLVGAGGAARAIGFGILSEGGKPTVVNILEDEGKTLATDLNVDYYHLSEFSKLEGDIVINATPLGMSPDIDTMPVSTDDLKKEMVVMDIVYNPMKTRLLKEAELIGCKTVDGVSMFVYQGAAQFEMWTEQKAPIDIMRETVLNALKK